MSKKPTLAERANKYLSKMLEELHLAEEIVKDYESSLLTRLILRKRIKQLKREIEQKRNTLFLIKTGRVTVSVSEIPVCRMDDGKVGIVETVNLIYGKL